MRKAWWLAAGSILATSSLRADWKIKTITTNMGGEESVRTEYYKGKLQRTDMELDGNVVAIWVMDRENQRQTAWDPHAKQYTVRSYGRTPHAAVAVESDAIHAQWCALTASLWIPVSGNCSSDIPRGI